jgi:hypothetical protein
MVERIVAALAPGQRLEYLYVDGHGSEFGMDFGLREDLQSQRLHVVTAGETMSSIAQRYYGTPARWQGIQTRNSTRIGNSPAALRAGSTLVIPGVPGLADVEHLRRLRARFAAGATVFLAGCQVGRANGLVRKLSELWGVHVRAGLANQRPILPGTEGPVLHCFIRRCETEPGTFWGVREGE